MTLKLRSWHGVFAIACGMAFLFAIRPACACLPMEYREVEPGEHPSDVAANAAKMEPGVRPRRAWAFGNAVELGRGRPDGYLIRGRRPGGWWDADFEVYPSPAPAVEDAPDLRPIE